MSFSVGNTAVPLIPPTLGASTTKSDTNRRESNRSYDLTVYISNRGIVVEFSMDKYRVILRSSTSIPHCRNRFEMAALRYRGNRELNGPEVPNNNCVFIVLPSSSVDLGEVRTREAANSNASKPLPITATVAPWEAAMRANERTVAGSNIGSCSRLAVVDVVVVDSFIVGKDVLLNSKRRDLAFGPIHSSGGGAPRDPVDIRIDFR